MPRPLHWKNLRIGLVAFLAIGAAVVSILRFAKVGALHGDKVTLYLVTNEATGVIKGTDVWLAGQKVGLVEDVQFRPTSIDTTERLAIRMQVLRQYMDRMRKNSDVLIRPGGNLIGAPVVYVTAGTRASPPVQDGDTLRARDIGEQKPTLATLADLGDSVSAIAREVKAAKTQLASRANTLAEIGARGRQEMGQLGAVMTRLSHGHGTLGRIMSDDALSRDLATLTAQTDSIRTLLASGRGNVGRFRRDSTLVPTAQRLLARVDTLRTRFGDPVRALKSPRGDSALVRQMNRVRVELDSLIRDVKKRPLKYLPF